MSSFRQPPFSEQDQLCHYLDQDGLNTSGNFGPAQMLPGVPYVQISNIHQVCDFLKTDLFSPDLEVMAPYLWMMSTESHSNINPLHRQRVKGREIILTEEPRLHLVWYYDRIFIKPLPEYLTSYNFWKIFLLSDSLSNPGPTTDTGTAKKDLCAAALGYLRTYSYLIRHKSDFNIARKAGLLSESMEWDQYCRFMSSIRNISDSQVSGRYRYGELRLSRLNFHAKFILRRFYFEQIHAQYAENFSRFYGPLLFIFAIISVALSAMQVELAVDQVSFTQWTFIWPVCRWISALGLISIVMLVLGLMLLLLFMLGSELIYSLKSHFQTDKRF
ncbi:hypothetical protein BP5796_03134 [Coleophoma crateriformis]|uniref:Subtilisin-like serine protease n=1 Tax=Coleophoma crateriformis TaxID=565419 RepID=A0A3D8SMA7_9HELO|nr:hypothetical protein BP5796_03134 [Coleophoma crateriformis]